jgi:hypothetical protein
MDYKTLFPVLEMGFLFLDIQLKPAICKGCSYWQVMSSTIEIPRQYPAKNPAPF